MQPEFKIEKGITLSDGRSKYRDLQWPFEAMQPGDSFLVNLVAEGSMNETTLRRTVSRASLRLGKRFAVRRWREGHRVWCL